MYLTFLSLQSGYGTIATSVTQWDMRRYTDLDNNPAGHNTVVIREAFQSGSSTINFSQLNYVAGTLLSTAAFSDGSTCVLMDGSDVYGASRDDGWLDVMKRYACTLEGGRGSVLILGLLQTKPNRTSLTLVGSQYGGPDFTETSPASAELNIDEYFYTDTEAEVTGSEGGVLSEVLPYDRGAKKWCRHVDVEVSNDSKSVALRPQCGIGAFRSGDGMGVVSGISLMDDTEGHFEYDGLVTTVGIKKRRFRFVSNRPVGTEGDVRAFVLSPSLSSAPLNLPPPDPALENCSDDHGCDASGVPLKCSCLQLCVGQTLKRVTMANDDMVGINNAGPC